MTDAYTSAQSCGCDYGALHLCAEHRAPHQPTAAEWGWIGVDLDGTLAVYPHSFPKVGPPIARMVDRVRAWLVEGKDVRIFTARIAVVLGSRSEHGNSDQAFADDQIRRITAWCGITFGCVLPITAVKDFRMVQCWDDRCTQVIPNTGETLQEHYDHHPEALELRRVKQIAEAAGWGVNESLSDWLTRGLTPTA
jgi:hypothetical protein